MKLYRHLPKRIAKKKIYWSWFKLNCAKELKPGDLISTCVGYNSRIIEITPCWSKYGCRKGSFICDYDVITNAGFCSITGCCTFPLETRKQIIEFWESFREQIEEEGRNRYNESCYKILDGLSEGKEVFNEYGELNEVFRIHR